MRMAPRRGEQHRNTIKIHLPLAVACKGGGGGTGLTLGPTPWCSVAVTQVRAHGLAIDSNSAACTGVGAALGIFGLALGLSTSCCPVQPCVESIEHPLRWAVRPLFGRFNLVYGGLLLRWAGRICWRWFGGAGDVGHQPHGRRTPADTSIHAGMYANKWEGFVSGTGSVDIVVEWRALVGHVIWPAHVLTFFFDISRQQGK